MTAKALRFIHVRVSLKLTQEQVHRLKAFAKGLKWLDGPKSARLNAAATDIYNHGEAHLMSDDFQDSLGPQRRCSFKDAESAGLRVVDAKRIGDDHYDHREKQSID